MNLKTHFCTVAILWGLACLAVPAWADLDRIAEDEEVVITRNGEPAGVLIGFRSAEDWAHYQLENDPRFLRRVEDSRRSFEAGRGVRLEDVED